MIRDVFERASHLYEVAQKSPPPRIRSGLSTERAGPAIDQALGLGYAVISQESEYTSERFVLLRESAPIKLGKLVKEDPGSLSDVNPPWSSDFLLYGLGVVSPCLHLGKDAEPYWTPLLTVLFCTSKGARQKLERLRRRFSEHQRSIAHEVIEDRNPFHPQGITVEYEAGSAFIAKTTSGLPDDYVGEADTWAARYAFRSRLFWHELSMEEDFAIDPSTGEVSSKLSISRFL